MYTYIYIHTFVLIFVNEFVQTNLYTFIYKNNYICYVCTFSGVVYDDTAIYIYICIYNIYIYI
jgi:hypothetical protein